MENEKFTFGAFTVLNTCLSFEGAIDTVSFQIVLGNPTANIATFQSTPQKVLVKHGLPIGGHIQDLIRAIKGQED